jgi:hypothetical protein
MDFFSENKMPGKSGGHVKNRKKYEALKDKGYSKTRAAKIANSGKEGSRKGGKHSHSHSH